MRAGRFTTVCLLALLAAAASGCATLEPLPPQSSGAPRATTARQAGVAPGAAPAAAAAAIDTVPSREAAAVLAAIPEPLAPGQRVAPAPRSTGADASSGTGVADSSAAPADSGNSDVPVPVPTVPLGDRPLPTILPSDSAAAPAPVAPHETRPATPNPTSAPAQSAGPDTCWRVQIAAPTERDKAERYRSAAESQLLVPMVIEIEKGLYKVRTKSCMDRAACDALKRRALDSGFTGAFRFMRRGS